MKVLVLGGAKSGKSTFALARAEELAGEGAGRAELIFLATARPGDEEMAARIAAHRKERGPAWRTKEEPLAVAPFLEAARPGQVVLVDCLTVWLANVMAEREDQEEAEMERLASAVAAAEAGLVLVANEVGLGIVPVNALARRFRDLAGRLNQMVAARATEVVLVTAGLAHRLK